MNLLERVLTLLRTNLNSVVEKSDDPEKILRQLQLDMRNQLVQVKTQVATAIAEGRRLQKRSEERSIEAEKLLKKAEQLIRQGNDDAARTALAHYNDFTHQAKRYLQQKKAQDQIVTTMRGALQQLEAKIAEADTTIDLLVASKRNALLQQRMYDTLSKGSNPRDKERAAQAQDAVVEAEARARALAELHNRDLTTQLELLSSQQLIEQQLSALKMRQTAEPPQLHGGGEAFPSPLLHPRPQSSSPVSKQEPEQAIHQDTSSPSGQSAEVTIEHLQKLLDSAEE